MSNFTFSDDLISDLHKDAFGYRPKGDYFAWWDSCSPDEKQTEWDSLYDTFVARENEEKAAEQRAVGALEQRIASLMSMGARNRAMAIRWIAEAYGCQDDIEHLEWNLGVPFGYLTKEFGRSFVSGV